ncbi:MAG: type II TA system antitoxin MqsA family protein [Thermodesulfobacteriota bacterium]
METMTCPTCKREGEIHVGKHHYTESGLQNVWLKGVEIFECECGENFAFIPCARELHNLIAEILLQKEDQLSGREIRFLRKHMGLKAKDFAKQIGVMNVTVSRWEREEIIPPKTIDRLIRYFYAAEMNFLEIAPKIKKVKFRKHKRGKKAPIINLPIAKAREACMVNA